MITLAVDPGTTQSGWVIWDGARVIDAGVSENRHVLAAIIHSEADMLAIERFEARGMPMGEESIETVIWTGRFIQAWRSPNSVKLVKRREVKSHLCGSAKAKDGNIRAAILDIVGPRGTKSNPGPTYPVKSHAWAALGVALTATA